jgi:1,4-alpha-glucan branching enzyme
MLFMGEEWAAQTPFLYFCDFAGALGAAVTAGRRKEFAGFLQFSASEVPDPNAETTMLKSRLDWSERDRPKYAHWLDYVRTLLALRRDRILPLIPLLLREGSRYRVDGEVLTVEWMLIDRRALTMDVNFGSDATKLAHRNDVPIFTTHSSAEEGSLPSWAVVWSIGPAA